MDTTTKVMTGIVIVIAIAFGFIYWLYFAQPRAVPASADTAQVPVVSVPPPTQSGGGFDTISIPPTPDGKG